MSLSALPGPPLCPASVDALLSLQCNSSTGSRTDR
uniref:Uncharacterized protein n=1 Tax=Anguilla anguilla TaxID=7936 RepID=A0A0E9UU94_ANGAN